MLKHRMQTFCLQIIFFSGKLNSENICTDSKKVSHLSFLATFLICVSSLSPFFKSLNRIGSYPLKLKPSLEETSCKEKEHHKCDRESEEKTPSPI